MPVKNTSFCQTLSNLQRGSTIDELDQLLTDALQASQDTGKVSKFGRFTLIFIKF